MIDAQTTLAQIEQLYEQVEMITFEPDMTPAEIREARSQLSHYYGQARRLYSRARRLYLRTERLLKNAQKTAIYSVPRMTEDGNKLTEKDREALAILALQKEPLQGMDKPIMTAFDEAEAVFCEAEALMDLFKDREDTIVTFNATNKLDAGLMGVVGA